MNANEMKVFFNAVQHEHGVKCIEPRVLLRGCQEDEPLSIINDFDRWFRVMLVVAENNLRIRKLREQMRHPNCRCAFYEAGVIQERFRSAFHEG